MNSANVTVKSGTGANFANPQELYFGNTTFASNLDDYSGLMAINLPGTMHSGSAEKTYITISQKDNGETSRAKLCFSYSVAANCQTAIIYFRDVTKTLANPASLSISYIVAQDRT